MYIYVQSNVQKDRDRDREGFSRAKQVLAGTGNRYLTQQRL